MSNLATDAPSLYNGNINYMVTTITNPTSLQKLAQLTAYRYDQLNRLLQMRAFDTLNLASNAWNNPGIYNGMYFNSFAYDAMGNMKTATAKNKAGVAIDNQDYNYQTIDGHKINNRLYSINDSALQTSGNDLLDQLDFDNTTSTINTANNYSYNEIGELKANKQDSIESIEWTVYGKIKSVTRTSGCHKYNLTFDYDPTGKRIAKHVYNNGDTLLYSEYYVHDAQGNIMSTYKYVIDQDLQTASYKQTEAHIYGSSSLGIDKTETELLSAPPLGSTYTHTLGNKQFTGSNHLGNTLVIFTDKKIQHDDNSDGIVDYYTANIVAANDYAPFGGLLTERTFNKGEFPNSFNGKRDDPELGDWQDYGERMYSLWGRHFPTPDPIFKEYPELSTYQFASNSPTLNIDLDGLEAAHTDEETGYIIPASDRCQTNPPAGTFKAPPMQGPPNEVEQFFLDLGLMTLGEINTVYTGEDPYGNQVGVYGQIKSTFNLLLLGCVGKGGKGPIVEAPRIGAPVPKPIVKMPIEKPIIEVVDAEKTGWKSEIIPYKKAQNITKGEKGAIQAHKLVEKRFASSLPKYNVKETPSIVLSKEQHQAISNELYNRLPKGKEYSPEKIKNAYMEAYKKYPLVQKAASDYIKKTK